MDRFFRFPLRALSAFATPRERLEKIVGFCVMHEGRKLVEKRDGDPDDLQEVWKCGCTLLKINWQGDGAASQMRDKYHAVLQACGTVDQATVTVKAAWLWYCLEGLRGKRPAKPLSYREFSVLCAVLSKVGNKKFASCSWREVQRRALGYATEREMQDDLPKRSDKAEPLSRQQVRKTLAALDRMCFFVRYAVGNGKRHFLSYYTQRMNPPQLAEAAMRDFHAKRHAPERMTAAARAEQAKLWRRCRRP